MRRLPEATNQSVRQCCFERSTHLQPDGGAVGGEDEDEEDEEEKTEDRAEEAGEAVDEKEEAAADCETTAMAARM